MTADKPLRRQGVGVATTIAVLLLIGLVEAGSANASSIAFVRDGDVFLVTPDGAREHRVTSGESYITVTQADDGTIFAQRPGRLDKLSPAGALIGAPISTGTAADPDVSPDGSKVALWHATSDGGRVSVVAANGASAGYGDQDGWYPTWIDNSVVLYSNGAGYINTLVSGSTGFSNWFSEPDGRKFSSAITRQGDKLVVVVRDWDDIGREFGPYKTVWYSNSSRPPTDGGFGSRPTSEQPTPRCTFNSDTQPTHPSFSPDGTAIAWEQNDSMFVQPVADLGSCNQALGFGIAGASSPDWGPADVPTQSANCVVPRLTGKTLAAARRALRKANCALGRVTRKRSRKKPGRVIKQSIRPGGTRPAGTRVGVTLAKR